VRLGNEAGEVKQGEPSRLAPIGLSIRRERQGRVDWLRGALAGSRKKEKTEKENIEPL